MEIEAFVKERRPRWDQLERILERAEKSSEREMDPRTLQELVRLYRLACSDLNQARSLTAQPLLLDRLNQLTGRGYRFVYRDARRLTLREQLAALFIKEIPAAFRRRTGVVGAAAAAMLLGGVVGFAAMASNPALGPDLIPGQFFTEDVQRRVAELERSDERISSLEIASAFSAQLFTHNIQVSFLCFSLGALTIVGGYAILFYNGVILGAVAAQYIAGGVSVHFFAWVGPHGSIELPSIVFSGAAGILAGRALLLPGNLSAGAAIREAFPDVRRMLLGTASLLVIAGLIEGSFSQFTNKTFPYEFKIGVAVVLFVLMSTYLFAGGRRPPEERP